MFALFEPCPITAEAFKAFGRILGSEGNERLPLELYGNTVNVLRPAAIGPTKRTGKIYRTAMLQTAAAQSRHHCPRRPGRAAAVDSSVETYTIVAEPLTPGAFAPFGTVLTRRDQERVPINLYGGKVDVYRPAPLDADQPLE